MADNQRQWLRKAVKAHLLPAFEQRGFVVVPLPDEELSDREWRSAFPFGRLRRAGPRGFEVVEIQMHRYDAALTFNIGVVPKDGGTFPSGHVGPDGFAVTWLDEWYELCRSPRFRRWFKVGRWPWTKVTKADYDALVKGIADLIPEVEQVFEDGTCGPHVKYVHMPRTTSTAKK